MGISTENVVIAGARHSKGSVDGVDFDFTELYLKESLDPVSGFGTATIPFKFGTSANYAMFAGLTNEVRAQADIMTITNGRGASKRVITAVRIAPPKVS